MFTTCLPICDCYTHVTVISQIKSQLHLHLWAFPSQTATQCHPMLPHKLHRPAMEWIRETKWETRNNQEYLSILYVFWLHRDGSPFWLFGLQSGSFNLKLYNQTCSPKPQHPLLFCLHRIGELEYVDAQHHSLHWWSARNWLTFSKLIFGHGCVGNLPRAWA